MSKFSERFKELRLKSGKTQKQLGEELSLSTMTIQRYEYGTRTPDFAQLIAIADYFDVSLDYLTGRDRYLK